MEIRPVERLILVMLSDIYEKLGCDNVSPTVVREAIYSGHHWALPWAYTGIFGPDPVEDHVVQEVTNILDMWLFIEEAGGERFPGFDTNREGAHASVARMITEHLGGFPSLKGRTGHGVLGLDGYRRMYEVFEPIRRQLGGDRQMNQEELDRILAERIHPSNR